MNKQTALLILLGVVIAGVLIPITPICRQVPTRDSGVFLHVGWRILNGEIPYRDVWDHKPPAIYYINALGLFIGKGSRWGVGWLTSVVLSWLLFFIAIRCWVDTWSAFVPLASLGYFVLAWHALGKGKRTAATPQAI